MKIGGTGRIRGHTDNGRTNGWGATLMPPPI